MSENNASHAHEADEIAPPISAFDAASYIFQVSREMALMAGAHGFSKIAASLELARALAAEELATLAVSGQSGSRNAAPDDAA